MLGARRLVAALVAGLCVLALTACGAPASHAGGPDPALRGQWTLVAAHTDDAIFRHVRNQNISLTIGTGATAVGRSSCYDYSATIYGSRNALWVEPRHPPTTACSSNDQQDLDAHYFAALKQVRRFTSHAGDLELSGPGVTLDYTIAANPSLGSLLDMRWRLTAESVLEADGTKHGNLSNGGAIVVFGSTGLLTAQTACALFIANFHQSAGVIITSDISSTPKSLCFGSDQRPDAQLRSALIAGFTVSYDTSGSETMTLSSYRAGIALEFVPDLNS
ncbi:MAG TPA: META domain-containing protein [Galbitalea sp.]|jgi:heat shock protein HslJ